MGFAIAPEYVAPSPEYDGVAYYWSHAYRHSLRDCTAEQRQAVRDALIAAKLPLDGESTHHEAIIDGIVTINTAMATNEELIAELKKCSAHNAQTGFMKNTLSAIACREEINFRKSTVCRL